MLVRQLLFFVLSLFVLVSANAARPRVKSTQPAVASNSQQVTIPAKVNINSADVATLQAVKGLGPKKAQAIVAYRNEHGAFKSLEDLTKVKGIGAKRLAKIGQSLTV